MRKAKLILLALICFLSTITLVNAAMDDPLTTNVDEGANEGDIISFKINGIHAQVVGTVEPRWTKSLDKLNIDLASQATDVETDRTSFPTEYALDQNYPNPFNPGTTIEYQIPQSVRSQLVKLDIYNTLGEKIRTLKRELQQPGSYSLHWDARDDDYRNRLLEFVEKASVGEGLTQEEIDELETMMRID